VVRVEDISTRKPGSARSSSGKAVNPSITGISTSSTTISTASVPVRRRISSTAWRPFATLATTRRPGSPSSMRDTALRMTAESSHIITRTGDASNVDVTAGRAG
jgi:hypothetical protein